MDFNEAVSAHQKWKIRLRSLIEGSSKEALDPATVAKDDQCDLGKWIHGDLGHAHSAKAEFQSMKRLHAEFHKVAAEVARKAKAGDRLGAEKDLDGPFYQASSAVVQAMLACKKACG